MEVLRSGASLRVNDQPRLEARFSRKLVRDLDFDSNMLIGAVANRTEGGYIGTGRVQIRRDAALSEAEKVFTLSLWIL